MLYRLTLILISLGFLVLTACSQGNNDVSELEPNRVNSNSATGMNDVSILYPLPSPSEYNALVSLNEEGLNFPEELWKKIPVLRAGTSNKITRIELRVIGMRLDPCFRERIKPQPTQCIPQLRLIVQSLAWNELQKTYAAADFAMHLFYELGTQEFAQILSEIKLATQTTRSLIVGAPLSVHPTLKKEGLKGSFGNYLRQLLLERFANRDLWRVTFMTLAGGGNQWTFGGYSIFSGAEAKSLVIPGTRFTRQTLNSTITVPVELNSRTIPVSEATDNLNAFAQGGSFAKLPIPEQKKVLFSLHRIENPNYHVADSIDCVSCHMTTMNKAWSMAHNIASAKESQFSFKSQQPLKNTSTVHPRAAVLRAFGYFESKVAISDRTIHETAQVLETLR